jgi:hypothetical protein
MAQTPLETLQQLRALAVDEAASVLASRRAETSSAGAGVVRAQQALQQQREERQRTHQEARGDASAGELRAQDLQCLVHYEHAARERERGLVDQGERARRALEQAVSQDERAERELNAARADARAVEVLNEQRAAELQRQRELSAEEEASELWQSARHKGSNHG